MVEFQYYFAQREALETIIYLYDVVAVWDKFDLMRFDGSGAVSPGMFDETWRRLGVGGHPLKGPLSLVEQFASSYVPTARDALMDQILFKWTGSDGTDPNSRGPYIDARKLAVFEKFFASQFVLQQPPTWRGGI